jgi:hypothetical protein
MITTMRARLRATIGRAMAACAVMLAASVSGARAEPQGERDHGEIHGLKLGLAAKSATITGFGELACGSNGGPPRARLETWADFGKCRPEDDGLFEVYARFDDEDEYIGKAIDDPDYAHGRTGTRVAGHPVILSVLFDAAGVARGLRFVTDPRATPYERRMAHLLRLVVINRYGPDGWTCTDAPPAAGETPVGGIFIKQRCEKATAERHLTVETRLLRKPGQNDIDPSTGDTRPGAFESSTRFEIFDPQFSQQKKRE